jgi:CBS domain-containing protein
LRGEEDTLKREAEDNLAAACLIDISDEDVLDAMKEIPGYLDITPEDFKEVYRFACRHAFERLTRTVKASQVMTREVVSVLPETPVAEVARIMAAQGVSGVPVTTREGNVVGVISEKDFLSLMGAGEYRNFMGVVAQCLTTTGCVVAPMRSKLAKEIMSAPPVTVRADTSVMQITAILAERKINRVPVVDESDRLVGIVSRADILTAPFAGRRR